MDMPDPDARRLPDAAMAQSALQGRLQWVGMEQIETLIQFESEGSTQTLPARASALVSLDDPNAKGVHMSRLYLLLDAASQRGPVDASWLHSLLMQMLESHAALSRAARIQLTWTLPLRRSALRSQHSGWRHYPVAITATLQGQQLGLEARFSMLYSSTCPSSAALARQLVAQRFEARFATRMPDRQELVHWLASEDGMAGTPHSQRSELEVSLTLRPGTPSFDFARWLDHLETAIPTPVQTAVKRLDEQAFAELNASHLMFCEDAARRAGKVLNALPEVADFQARAIHRESLHPHDAVALVSKHYQADSEAK